MKPKVTTGIEGLDSVLAGGFPANRVYLVEGDPGVGKTTLALQFLLEGARLGESSLYVTISESLEEIRAVAESHGWDLSGVAVFELSAADTIHEDENTLYVPAEIELGERLRSLVAEVDRVKPRRIVIDSCSELRLLAQTPLRFRRQILALKEDLVKRQCTILLLDNPSSTGGDALLQSLVHGVIHLEQLAPMYGAERRRLRVIKLREVRFRGGFHDFTIASEGIVVFPRLIAAEHRVDFVPEPLPSGVKELDSLLGGGLDRGTATLFMGPAGTGKSAFATRYACAAADRGEHVVMFAFDERVGTLLARSRALGMNLDEHAQSGKIVIQQVDPAELSPGEFIHIVQRAVEDRDARMVVIDSLNGYMNAMPEEQFVVTQMHELLTYLGQRGVLTVMLLAQHGVVGPMMATPLDVSYVSDTVVLLRYFEAEGRVKKAVSVMKKRSGRHEDTIREFFLGPEGLTVGPPLAQFRGVLTGVPNLIDPGGPGGSPAIQEKRHG